MQKLSCNFIFKAPNADLANQRTASRSEFRLVTNTSLTKDLDMALPMCYSMLNVDLSVRQSFKSESIT